MTCYRDVTGGIKRPINHSNRSSYRLRPEIPRRLHSFSEESMIESAGSSLSLRGELSPSDSSCRTCRLDWLYRTFGQIINARRTSTEHASSSSMEAAAGVAPEASILHFRPRLLSFPRQLVLSPHYPHCFSEAWGWQRWQK
jgi:hypothetical protein